jgi:hypothetical protein
MAMLTMGEGWNCWLQGHVEREGMSGEQGLHGITWEPCLSMLPVCICVQLSTVGWAPLAEGITTNDS